MDSKTENLHARSEPTTICQLSTFNVFHETFLCLGKSKSPLCTFFAEQNRSLFQQNGGPAPLEEAGRLAAGGRAGGRLGGREEEAPGGVPGGAWPAFPPVLAAGRSPAMESISSRGSRLEDLRLRLLRNLNLKLRTPARDGATGEDERAPSSARDSSRGRS